MWKELTIASNKKLEFVIIESLRDGVFMSLCWDISKTHSHLIPLFLPEREEEEETAPLVLKLHQLYIDGYDVFQTIDMLLCPIARTRIRS